MVLDGVVHLALATRYCARTIKKCRCPHHIHRLAKLPDSKMQLGFAAIPVRRQKSTR